MAAIPRVTLSDQLAHELKRLILSGAIPPGERLPTETELMRRHGVGRSTVREAIRALVLLGVVDVKPGSGTRVRTDALDRLSSAFGVRERLAELNARQLYEARRAIEAELAALAAVRATEAEVQQIGQAVRRLEMHQDDPEAFTQADLDFHRAVARAGRNPLLEQFYYSSERHLVAIIRNIIELPGVRARATELHRNTYRAIRARDPLRARRSVIAHMEYAQSLLEDDEDPTTALPTE